MSEFWEEEDPAVIVCDMVVVYLYTDLTRTGGTEEA